MIIYKITNKVNGKVYIGQTIHTLNHRKNRHIECVHNGTDRHLYNAMRKYGIDNFVFEEIDHADNIDDLNYLESYYITKYDSVRTGYNMGYGGDNNVMFSQEVKSKHDTIMRSDSVRDKISKSMKAYRQSHPFTDEHKAKLSQKAKGNHNFGSGDTRSISCYCVLIDGSEKHFHSYRDAYRWWRLCSPFDTQAECTHQRKIKQSIENGVYTYKNVVYEFPKWFREEGDVK